MTPALLLSVLWALAAALAASRPPRHGSAVLTLIVTGVPIAGLATYQHGPLLGLAVLTLGVFELRWQVLRAAPSGLGRDAAE